MTPFFRSLLPSAFAVFQFPIISHPVCCNTLLVDVSLPFWSPLSNLDCSQSKSKTAVDHATHLVEIFYWLLLPSNPKLLGKAPF